jgi:IS1 family transposase
MISMNRLSVEDRARIVSCLVEGMGVRPTARVVGVSVNTVQKLIRDLAPACWRYHDEKVRGLSCEKIQADEAWAFNYCREKNVVRAKAAPKAAGDVWVWTAICAQTKIVPTWYVGDRDSEAAWAFMGDLGHRIEGRFELNTDGLPAYRHGLMNANSSRIDYAQIVKTYATPSGVWNDRENRYQGPRLKSVRRRRIRGNPDVPAASTSFSERMNLGIRMQGAKMRRLSNTHAKRIEMLRNSMTIYYVFYNFCRPHQSLGGQTPAMAAGLTDRWLTTEDLVALGESA